MTNSSIIRDRHFIAQSGYINYIDKNQDHYQFYFDDGALTVFVVDDGRSTLICKEHFDVDEIIIDIDKGTNIVTIEPSYDKFLKKPSVVKCEIHLAPVPFINRKEQEQQQQEQLAIAELFL